jgi:hypothetical protein
VPRLAATYADALLADFASRMPDAAAFAAQHRVLLLRTADGFGLDIALRARPIQAGAIEWLEHAVNWGFCSYRFLSELSPFLAPLRGHPRFEALLERAREKERAFEV